MIMHLMYITVWCIGNRLNNENLSSCDPQSCSSKMKNLSRENIPESKVAMLDVPLLFMAILEVLVAL